MKFMLIALHLFFVALNAAAAPLGLQVSDRTRVLFEKTTPCPVTKFAQSGCTGYRTVYVDPLCHGGKDNPANVKWLPIPDMKRKEIEDQALCLGSFGSGAVRHNLKTSAQTGAQAKHPVSRHAYARAPTSSSCYTGPRGGRYRIVNGRKRYGC